MRPVELARASADLWACDVLLARHASLGAELRAAEARLKACKAQAAAARRKRGLEAEDARALRLPGPTMLVAAVLGQLGERRRKEERELAWADVAARAAEEEVARWAAQAGRLKAALATLDAEHGRRRALLQRKATLLAGLPQGQELDALAATLASIDVSERHLREALARSEACRALVRGLRATRPHGDSAGGVDMMFGGALGAAASGQKHGNRLAYGGMVWELREALRDLDASPVVDVPELVEAIRFPNSSPNVRSADYATDLAAGLPGVLGLAGSVAAVSIDLELWAEANWGRKADLDWLAGKLARLEDRLRERMEALERERARLLGRWDEVVQSA